MGRIAASISAASMPVACSFDRAGLYPYRPENDGPVGDGARDLGADQRQPDTLSPGYEGQHCLESSCPLGCLPDLTRCYRIRPSTPPEPVFEAPGAGDWTIGADVVINTSPGATTEEPNTW